MTRTRHVTASAVIALLLGAGASPAVLALDSPRIIAEDPGGGPPGEHFTDLTLVPGDTVSSTIIVSQNTGSTVQAGVRFESPSGSSALLEQAELTIQGLGTATTAPLGELLESDTPIWLGELPSDEAADVSLSVHLPAGADNDTKRTHAGFQVIVTARGDLPRATPSPDPNPSGTGEPKPEPSGDPDPDPDESLPRTGTEVLLLLLAALGLVGVGAAARAAARRR